MSDSLQPDSQGKPKPVSPQGVDSQGVDSQGVDSQGVDSQGQLLRQRVELLIRDRRLLSHEIHDGLIQYMIGAKMFIESALAEDENATLVEAVSSLQRAIEEARQIISEQRWQLDIDLASAVQGELESRLSPHRIQHELSVIGREHLAGLSPEVALTARRILQEALSNVIRHSQAKRVLVSLTLDTNSLNIAVEDDGVGFGSESADATSGDSSDKEVHGIQGMRLRTDAFNGEFAIASSPSTGTKILVKLPLTDPLQS